MSRIAHANFHVSVSVPYPVPTNGRRVSTTTAASASPARTGMRAPLGGGDEVMGGPLLQGQSVGGSMGPRPGYRPDGRRACVLPALAGRCRKAGPGAPPEGSGEHPGGHPARSGTRAVASMPEG